MSAILTSPPATSLDQSRARLHDKMLAVGWSPDDIRLIESAMTSARLHDIYLRAGYSPDEIAQIISLY